MVACERRDIVVMLRTLSNDEWAAPSLCAGWRVRDVAAHLCADALSPLAYGGMLVRRGFAADRLNNDLVDQSRSWPADRIIATLESTVGKGTLAAVMPTVVLADLVVHHQDMLRPLGRSRVVPPDRLLATLKHPDPFANPRKRTHGLRFVATDIDWQHGSGPEIRGPGEALALAVAGRPAALADLSGPGLTDLESRLA